jgi:hypothetical protein
MIDIGASPAVAMLYINLSRAVLSYDGWVYG